MSPPTQVSNGDIAAVISASAPVTSRLAAVYSEVQRSRIDHALPLPSVLRNPFKIVDGPASSAAGNPGYSRNSYLFGSAEFSLIQKTSIPFESLFRAFLFDFIDNVQAFGYWIWMRCFVFYCFSDEIAKLFPHVYGQPSTLLVPSDTDVFRPDQKLKIGVVLSGGQAPGGHNVISGIYGEDLTEPVIRRRFINY